MVRPMKGFCRDSFDKDNNVKDNTGKPARKRTRDRKQALPAWMTRQRGVPVRKSVHTGLSSAICVMLATMKNLRTKPSSTTAGYRLGVRIPERTAGGCCRAVEKKKSFLKPRVVPLCTTRRSPVLGDRPAQTRVTVLKLPRRQ